MQNNENRTMRMGAPIAIAIACVASIVMGADQSEVPGRRLPNILFIAVDDLRPSLGCYGELHAITPHLDLLAQRSVVFDNAYCQVAVCNPSRASLMTGLRPDTLNVWTLPIHFREAKPDAVTMPQWFRKHGYQAVSHGKIYHNPTPDPQSWSEPIRKAPILESGYPPGTPARIREAQAQLAEDDWRKNNLRGPATAAPDVADNQLIDGARTDMGIEDLRRLGRSSAPFFLAMGYIRPHLAWIAPKRYWDLHDPLSLPIVVDGKVTPGTPPYALSNSYELTHYVDLIDFPTPWDEQRVSQQQARQLMHGYYACVSYIDAQIGRLLDALVEEGLQENTIIVLWADHGWKLGEFNGWGKMTNYEIDARVPLLIAAPGLPTAGQRSQDLAELIDLFPTLCDLASIPKPEFVEGTSLLPNLLDTATHVKDAAYSQYYRKHEQREYMGYALRTRDYRFVEWRDFSTGEVTARELYDHRQEHSETKNIADSAPPELLDALTAQLLESHPRRPLSLLPAVHSDPSPGRWRTSIEFSNQSNGEVMIYPISSAGKRGKVKLLQAGEQLSLPARIGGVFVVESRDGTIYEIHSPSYPARTNVLQ